ncbi:hypothetical protein K466DRAFT_499685, partial [Polyporus arcularius HHB13444]
QKNWTAPVYAFYKPEIVIIRQGDRIGYRFDCAKPGCTHSKTRWTDTKDSTSTQNLRRHVESCWGREILAEAQAAGSAKAARPGVEAFGRTGTIEDFFERKGKGKVTYSIRSHTAMETRCTGRPEYQLPSPSTVSRSRDVQRVFLRCRARIAKMLQDFEGELSYTMDAWTSPNHKALVAFAVHLHHDGEPLSFLLDVVEVAESHTGVTLARVFEEMMRSFAIEEKVSES